MTWKVHDNVLAKQEQTEVADFLNQPGWKWGWRSNRKGTAGAYDFWHKHFAGARSSDHPGEGRQKPYDCADELRRLAPIPYQFWQLLARTALKDCTLVRCYANAHPYGSEGTLHTDSASPDSLTSIYYPALQWSPNWGGETVFFNKEETDAIAAIYPKPNRLLVFSGNIPHAARGITRMCPMLRITLMFKTEKGPLDGSQVS